MANPFIVARFTCRHVRKWKKADPNVTLQPFSPPMSPASESEQKLIFAMIAPVVLALNQQAKNFAITVFGINGGVC